MWLGCQWSCPAPHKGTRFFHISFKVYWFYLRLTWWGGNPPHPPSLKRPPAHAEDETTPSLVWFRVRRISYSIPHMPSTQPHPRWCDFVFGILSLHATPPQICRAQQDTIVGVFSCSASFFHPPHMPNAKMHPRWCRFMFGVCPSSSTTHQAQKCTLVGVFCVQHLFKNILNIY